MTALASTRAEAARKANRTRRIDESMAALRGFDGAEKAAARTRTVDFLVASTRDGEAIGDLLGLGESARQIAASNRRVIAVENGGWFKTRMPVADARVAAERIAASIPCELRWGDLSDNLAGLAAVNADVCGPYAGPTSRLVAAITRAGIPAFALTCELSRLDGHRGLTQAHYVASTRARLAVDAPGYQEKRCLVWRGEANIPMAVFHMWHPGHYTRRLGQSLVSVDAERTACRKGYGKACPAPRHFYPCSRFVSLFAMQMGVSLTYARQWLARCAKEDAA